MQWSTECVWFHKAENSRQKGQSRKISNVQMFWSICVKCVEFFSQKSQMDSTYEEGQTNKQGLYQRKRSDRVLTTYTRYVHGWEASEGFWGGVKHDLTYGLWGQVRWLFKWHYCRRHHKNKKNMKNSPFPWVQSSAGWAGPVVGHHHVWRWWCIYLPVLCGTSGDKASACSEKHITKTTWNAMASWLAS